jgi:hypothetical protein
VRTDVLKVIEFEKDVNVTQLKNRNFLIGISSALKQTFSNLGEADS